MILSLIAATSENGVIGKNGWLPWELPAELQHFRAVTRQKPVIMGRKTYESIASRGRAPLPQRHNIVVSRNADISFEGADVVHSLEEAIACANAQNPEEICVIGGGQLYAEALPHADRVYLTTVHTVIEDGDAFFPPMNDAEWQCVEQQEHAADEENPHAFTVRIFDRKNP